MSRSSTKTVCILGGTGFVGRSLAARLIREGYSVRIPTRNRQRHRRLLVLPGIDLVQTDIHDERRLNLVLSGADVAVNLVGILNEKGHDGSGFKAVHVELTEKLVAACLENGIPRLLHMSALKANAERGASHYLRTKGQAEQMLKHLAGEDLRYTIFQPSVIFGPEDDFINRFATYLKLFPALPLPKPDARFAPVYVDDVARAFSRALREPATHGRTYQLCGPTIYSLREIVTYIGAQLGVKRRIVGLPDFLSRMQAGAVDYLVPGKPFSLDNYRSLTVASVCTENGLDALNIAPTSMEVIVPEYLGPPHDYQNQLSQLRQSSGR